MRKTLTIPLGFYFSFWLRNSALALGSGFLIVYLIPPLFVFAPWTCLIFVMIYQIKIYKYFFGNLRGDFEYVYREAMIEKIIRKAIIKKYGIFVFLRYLSDRLSQIRTFNENFILKLSQENPKGIDDGLEFVIYMKLAELSLKNDDYGKERTYLEKAIEMQPKDLVANFRLAVSFEGAGEAAAAIEHYKAALQDPNLFSDQLKKFITTQISLVETGGPRKRPPTPGLRFLTW